MAKSSAVKERKEQTSKTKKGGRHDDERKARDDRMTGKEYDQELRKLQTELVHLQEWVKAKGARVVIVFEGRDAAGKGGTINALTERVSPVRACFAELPCRPHRTAKSPRCTFSAIFSIFQLPVKLWCSIAVGTTELV
jgi:polyphosphate kinase 2 (PPK2 family)